MTVYERIEYLRKKEGISQGNLEKELSFSNGSISKWKSSMPKPERLEKIANHFGVTIDFLMGKTDMVVCPVCGFGDNPLSEQSRKEHEEFHKRFLLAKEKYTFLMNYTDADKLRTDSISQFRNPQNSIDDRLLSFQRYLEAAFSLEINKRNYDITNLDFAEFCKVEVAMLEPDWVISEELIDILIEKHGVNKNFLNGNEQLLARASNNERLMRLLAYAERLSPAMLDSIEIQLKALAENEKQG